MDPNATLLALVEALYLGDTTVAEEMAGYLHDWLGKGGSPSSNITKLSEGTQLAIYGVKK